MNGGIFMNTLYELGLEDLCNNEDFFMNVVAKYTITDGDLFNGYYGKYIWRRLGLVEMNFHLSPEDDSYVISGFTSNVSGNNFWRMAVTNHGIIEIPDDEDNEAPDYLSRYIYFTHPETKKGNVPINLVNADVIPDFYPGDTYTMQVIAFTSNVDYYKDEDSYMEHPITRMKGHPVTFALDNVTGVINSCVAAGQIKRVTKKHSYNSKSERVEFYSVEIQTDFGILEILHSESCIKDGQKDLIKPGMIVKAQCILFGDVAVGDYQQGATMDEAHITRLLRGCFDSGDFTRVSRLFSDDCKYIRASGEIAADGGKKVLNFLTGVANSLNEKGKNLSAYPAVLDSYCEQEKKQVEKNEHKIGTPLIAISHIAGEMPSAILVIKLNKDKKINEIKSLGPEYGYIVHIDFPKNDLDSDNWVPIPTSFTEDEWLEMLGKRFEECTFDDNSFYYGLDSECVLGNEQKWDIDIGEDIKNRENMFTYLSMQVTKEKHDISFEIIDGKKWNHNKVLKVIFDGRPRIYAVDINEDGHLAKLYEYD